MHLSIKSSKKKDTDRIKDFFEKRACDYDLYYHEDKSAIRKGLDFLFRRSIAKRFKMALAECGKNDKEKILDVGCGSARFAVDLLNSGKASRVTGIDFSSSMIDLAKKRAEESRLSDKCEFIYREFESADINGRYDISVALGFFDYTRDPSVYLNKIKTVTTGKIIASFPAKWRIRNIIRVFRLSLLDCPVYFYTPSQIKAILKSLSISDYTIKSIDRDYFVVVNL